VTAVNNSENRLETHGKFFAQLEDFCRLVQEEFLSRFNELTSIPASAADAFSFTETLMLCPTEDAVRACIRKELTAALSFVLAIQGMQRKIQAGSFKLPAESPEHQTRFYLLAAAVRDYLEAWHAPVEA
jgi:hypothetical protein